MPSIANNVARSNSGNITPLDEATIRAACRCKDSECECHREGGNVHCPNHYDRTPSLSVGKRNRKVVWHCLAGCDQKDVTRSIIEHTSNWKLPVSRPDKPPIAKVTKPKSTETKSPKPTKTREIFFDYKDARGNRIYQVVRKEYSDREKDFIQRRPDGNGGWIYNLQGIETVLYRLSQVVGAHTVFVCEGEKAADRLNEELDRNSYTPALCATTAPMGAGKWREEYSEALAGKEVVFLPDNDDAGRAHAAKACPSIARHAARVQVLALPYLQEKGDVYDWIENGGTLETLLQLAKVAPEWTPLESIPQAKPNEAPDDNSPRRKFTIYSADSVLNQAPPIPIIDGILYAGTVAQIVGDAASYKSFQGIAICEAVAGGHEWQGHQTQQMPVLCVVGEGGSGQRQRIKALQNFHQRPCQAQFILEAVQIHRPDDVDALLWAITQLPQAPGLIVIDTLARCFVGGDENSARDAGLFVAGLDHIRAATGATVLVIHHVGKSGDARGSTAFTGAMDTIIEAKRNHDTVTLKCLKQKDAPEFEPFSLVRRKVELGELDEMGRELTSLIFEPTGVPPATSTIDRAEITEQTVLTLLPQTGAKSDEWFKAAIKAGVSKTSFYRARDGLREKKQVELDTKTGIYHRSQSSQSSQKE